MSQLKDQLRAEILLLKEQVNSRDNELRDKDKQLDRLKAFIRHFKGDSQSAVRLFFFFFNIHYGVQSILSRAINS